MASYHELEWLLGDRRGHIQVLRHLLANIFLHYVLDVWFEYEVKPRLKGRAWMVRFADDFVMGFELEEDARRVFAVLPKRFAKHGLEIHPEKTRLLPFFPLASAGDHGTTFNTGNAKKLGVLFDEVKRIWHYWLNRRSSRRDMTWERYQQLLKRFPLPVPRVVHSVYAQ